MELGVPNNNGRQMKIGWGDRESRDSFVANASCKTHGI